MIRPTIRQLEYLITLQKTGSFSLAAEHCNVTQSTLSAGIKELESVLDQPLVNRGRKNITLTPFGLETVDQAIDIIDKFSASNPYSQSFCQTDAQNWSPDVVPKSCIWLKDTGLWLVDMTFKISFAEEISGTGAPASPNCILNPTLTRSCHSA